MNEIPYLPNGTRLDAQPNEVSPPLLAGPGMGLVAV